LTADGGHPGNNRAHAAVRRWTAPHAMTVNVSSNLRHEAAPGDGIRAFIVSSRTGLLASTPAHQSTHDLNAAALEVAAGETIDFLVDIGDVLNNDQYLWEATITPMGSDPRWSSQSDFGGAPIHLLTPWEQLAHVLLCANEFLFVD